MNKPSRNKYLIISVIVTIMVLASLVSATMNVKKIRKNFADEMAQRFDLEEKMSKMDKERRALDLELKSLKEELSKRADDLAVMREKLDKEQKEKIALKESLEKVESQLKGIMQQ